MKQRYSFVKRSKARIQNGCEQKGMRACEMMRFSEGRQEMETLAKLTTLVRLSALLHTNLRAVLLSLPFCWKECPAEAAVSVIPLNCVEGARRLRLCRCNSWSGWLGGSQWHSARTRQRCRLKLVASGIDLRMRKLDIMLSVKRYCDCFSTVWSSIQLVAVRERIRRWKISRFMRS
jgi:hypothetical protein